jgi:protein TonB
MHAATEAARVLAGADGVALALRTKGLVVCRARSGDPTPELGSPLNTESGISGECLRAASILVCDDTFNDARVDPQVCRDLGIRSIVAVPLRGPIGIAGILEAFSTHTRAFGDEQINALRGLAEIAEAAYEREVRTLQEAAFASLRTTRTRSLFTGATSPPAPSQEQEQEKETPTYDEVSLARRYWVLGIGVAAVLLVAGVWLSGREPAPEVAAKAATPAIHSTATEPPAPTPVLVTTPKPRAGIAHSNSSRILGADTVQNAAEIEATGDSHNAEMAITMPPPSHLVEKVSSPPTFATPDPPVIIGGPPPSADQLPRLNISANTLPKLDAAVSQGITEGRLIHRTDPAYPTQARAQHIAGTVTFEMTIGEDGGIREVKLISGPSVLAAAASEAIRKWRYTPFLLNGKPIAVQKQVSVVFKLP